MEANWIGLLLVVLGAWLAFKLLGAALRLMMWLVVLVGAYWFLAPMLGWPTVPDLVYVFGPDLDGRRIEEVLAPGQVADGIGRGVADGVMEALRPPEPPSWPEPVEESPGQPAPEGTEGTEDGLAPLSGSEGGQQQDR